LASSRHEGGSDDIFPQIERYLACPILETGQPLETLQPLLISANAYLGAQGIVQALQEGADVVITGRVADPALVLGPLIFEFGWNWEDAELLGKGTLAGHLLECGAQVTGGYFADPGYKDVPGLATLGFPIAEVAENPDGDVSAPQGASDRPTRQSLVWGDCPGRGGAL
jgi:Acyclic terpene utilisation family protein AtuA